MYNQTVIAKIASILSPLRHLYAVSHGEAGACRDTMPKNENFRTNRRFSLGHG
jgi:hypothetical protein